MKPARVRIDGKRYMVNKHGVVAEICENDPCNVLGFETIQFCDIATSEMVIATVKRLRAKKNRLVRDQIRRDLGLVRVSGALGRTYWE